jgi:hypothetical protein
MTDLELRLLHCEREPSQVALYDAADAYRDIDDLEMYHALKYMADNRKMPWKSKYYFWWECSPFDYGQRQHAGFSDYLTSTIMAEIDLQVKHFAKFADAVRWLGKRLIELGTVTA